MPLSSVIYRAKPLHSPRIFTALLSLMSTSKTLILVADVDATTRKQTVGDGLPLLAAHPTTKVIVWRGNSTHHSTHPRNYTA